MDRRTFLSILLLFIAITVSSCTMNSITPSSLISVSSVSLLTSESAIDVESPGSQDKTSEIKYQELFSSNLQYGTTSGNIMNDGICAISSDCVYFSNSNFGDCMFKIQRDGTGLKQISNDRSDFINFYNGYIYFIYNVFNDESFIAKADISSDEILFLNNDNAADFLCINDGAVYYISYLNNEGYLRKYIDPDHSEIIVKKNIQSYQFTENHLIYLTGEPDSRLYIANKDGTGEQKVTSEEVSFFLYDSGWIYYIDNLNHWMYRISEDGITETILDGTNIGRFNIYDGWIYYVDKSANNSLYKIKIDRTRKTKLAKEDCFNINIFGYILVYQADSGSSFVDLHWIRTDGTGESYFN